MLAEAGFVEGRIHGWTGYHTSSCTEGRSSRRGNQPEADDADVTARFSQVEHERGLTGWHEGFASDVARWERALG